MEQEQVVRLIIRQLKDIQAQADAILSGDNSKEKIENFARYSIELKRFIIQHYDTTGIQQLLKELPEVNYARLEIRLWQYFVLPAWWFTIYKDYAARQKILEQINTVRGKYASLLLLMRGNSVITPENRTQKVANNQSHLSTHL